MEPDDLKAAWRSLDAQIQRQQEVHSRLLTELRVDKAKSRLRPLMISQGLTLVVGIGVTAFAARYWLSRLEVPVALVSGLLLHLWSIGLIISAVMQLLMLTRINYAEPVLTLQRTLGHLWLWRTRFTPLLGVAFWVLWLPVAVILLDVVSTGQLAGALSPSFLLWNLVVGVAGVAATLGFYRWAHQPSRRKLGESLDDGNAGRAVLQARAFLDELEDFQKP